MEKKKLNIVFSVISVLVLLLVTFWIYDSMKGKGVLRVITNPGGAYLYIDGDRIGSSPVQEGQSFDITLKEGKYKLEAVIPVSEEHERYGSIFDVYVAAESTQILKIDLTERETESAFENRVDREKKQYELYVKEHPNVRIEPKMVDISAGKLQMGCSPDDTQCDDDEKPAHWVNLSAFKISETEATFESWDAYVAAGGTTYIPKDEGWGRSSRPVINVSWEDVQGYIEWLNRVTGKKYSLPTEAQWEYAARAGSKTKYFFGSNENQIADYAWFWGNSSKQTQAIGTRKPNAWGLYDMHGNVWEWCKDWKSTYTLAESTNPAGPSLSKDRTARGGSWYNAAWLCRTSIRSGFVPGYRNNSLGFRLVLL
ncbi:MAG: SUMF1/EgtB/PvdO family nonheme iron enzyme [Desulfobacteraceae bacterium]